MDILLKAIPIAIPVILVILIFLMGYVKAPPDVAYIISGLRKHPKVLIGKAGIKLPFFERLDKLSDGPGGHPAGYEELPEYDGGRLQPGYRGFLAGQHA